MLNSMLKRKEISPSRKRLLEVVTVVILSLVLVLFLIMTYTNPSQNNLIVAIVAYLSVVSFGMAMVFDRKQIDMRMKWLWTLWFILLPPFSLIYFSLFNK
jgi:drug/metabolite transporter (DMT)-like permease